MAQPVARLGWVFLVAGADGGNRRGERVPLGNRPALAAVVSAGQTWWALRDSNPRPSPCKGDALPAELSARTRGVAAATAHDLPQRGGQTRRAASLAPVQAVGPVRAVVLAIRTHQHLHPARHRPRPRHLSLVGIEGGTVAEEAPRPVRRPHDTARISPGGPRRPPERSRSGGREIPERPNHLVSISRVSDQPKRSVLTARSTTRRFSSYTPSTPLVAVVCTISVVSGSSSITNS
jgi:hypothetical protein